MATERCRRRNACCGVNGIFCGAAEALARVVQRIVQLVECQLRGVGDDASFIFRHGIPEFRRSEDGGDIWVGVCESDGFATQGVAGRVWFPRFRWEAVLNPCIPTYERFRKKRAELHAGLMRPGEARKDKVESHANGRLQGLLMKERRLRDKLRRRNRRRDAGEPLGPLVRHIVIAPDAAKAGPSRTATSGLPSSGTPPPVGSKSAHC